MSNYVLEDGYRISVCPIIEKYLSFPCSRLGIMFQWEKNTFYVDIRCSTFCCGP